MIAHNASLALRIDEKDRFNAILTEHGLFFDSWKAGEKMSVEFADGSVLVYDTEEEPKITMLAFTDWDDLFGALMTLKAAHNRHKS